MDNSKTFFSGDAFAKDTGIELLEVSSGRAKVKMEIAEKHKNSHGTVHGGVIFTLADCAFGLASNSHGIPAVGINATISYMKSSTSGTLYAEACEFSKKDGEKIALFQGMVYRKTPR